MKNWNDYSLCNVNSVYVLYYTLPVLHYLTFNSCRYYWGNVNLTSGKVEEIVEELWIHKNLLHVVFLLLDTPCVASQKNSILLCGVSPLLNIMVTVPVVFCPKIPELWRSCDLNFTSVIIDWIIMKNWNDYSCYGID